MHITQTVFLLPSWLTLSLGLICLDDSTLVWFEMVSLQEIDGYWELAKEVTSLLQISQDALKSLDIVKVCVLQFMLVYFEI